MIIKLWIFMFIKDTVYELLEQQKILEERLVE